VLLAWLSVPPSGPRSRTVNCCSTATAAAGGVLDGSAGWVESSQAARLARSQTPHTVRFMKDLRAESEWYARTGQARHTRGDASRRRRARVMPRDPLAMITLRLRRAFRPGPARPVVARVLW